jgi:hypothetical protein
MAAKKKAKKKTPANKARTRKAASKKSGEKKLAPKKKLASKKSAKKTLRSKTISRSAAGLAKSKSSEKRIPKAARRSGAVADPRNREVAADEDSQGLSTVEQADSESVGELLDEGNAFEAGVVEGVEEADDSDEREVRTHEFPEDDVPEEYLDKD